MVSFIQVKLRIIVLQRAENCWGSKVGRPAQMWLWQSGYLQPSTRLSRRLLLAMRNEHLQYWFSKYRQMQDHNIDMLWYAYQDARVITFSPENIWEPVCQCSQSTRGLVVIFTLNPFQDVLGVSSYSGWWLDAGSHSWFYTPLPLGLNFDPSFGRHFVTDLSHGTKNAWSQVRQGFCW